MWKFCLDNTNDEENIETYSYSENVLLGVTRTRENENSNSYLRT